MAHTIQEKQLGQAAGTTVATSIYSPPADTSTSETTTIIKTICVCNYTASPATFSIYLDDDGTTYDNTTVMFGGATISGHTTVQIDTLWAMDNPSGNLAVATSVNSAVTITVFGAEIS